MENHQNGFRPFCSEITPPTIHIFITPTLYLVMQAGRQAALPPHVNDLPLARPCQGCPLQLRCTAAHGNALGPRAILCIISHKMQDKFIEKSMQFDLDGVLALLHYTMDMHWVQNSQSARCIPQCSEIQND